MTSFCVITNDVSLMHRFIDWINKQPYNENETKLYTTDCDVEVLISNLYQRLDVASHFCDIRKCVKCKGYYADGYVCSCGYDSSGENE